MFGQLRKTVKWTFIVTLPLTSFPVLTGTFSGIMFGFWSRQEMNENTRKFLYEVKDAVNDWGVGGDAPTFRQFQDTHNDFHLLKINSNDWTRKLGFMLPDEYTNFEGGNSYGIDKLASLNDLLYDSSCQAVPKAHWMYLSNLAWPAINDWDRAFDQVVQKAYVHPELNKTKLHFAKCIGSAGFLCGVWSTRAPALVHFLVEDEPLDPEVFDPDLTYSTSDPSSLRKVTTRIIEFPLKDGDVYTGTAFPSETEQMHSAMTMVEQFEPYDSTSQMLMRFTEYMDRAFWDAEGTVWHYYNRLDNWIVDHVTTPMGIEDILSLVHSICFTLSAASSTGALAIARMIWNTGERFLGRPTEGDWIMGDVDEEIKSPKENFWGPLMDGFWEHVEKKIAEERSSGSKGEQPLTTGSS